MEKEVTMTVYLLGLIICTGLGAKFVIPPCDQHMFDSNVRSRCLSDFNQSMVMSAYEDSCLWPTAKRAYNNLKHCVDDWAVASWCNGYKFHMDKFFLEVHQTYFSLCGQVQDPPFTTVIVLVAPAVIVTLLLPFLCFYLTT